ncbi:MAG: hypothetical protein ACSHYB_11950 [Roseibacillus sp.]
MALRKAENPTSSEENDTNLILNTSSSSRKVEMQREKFTATKSSNSVSKFHHPLVNRRIELAKERDRNAKEGLGPKHPVMLQLSKEIEKLNRDIKRLP